jgi:hypothetical protein
VVHKLLYLGSAWEIEVMVEQDIVTVRTEQMNVTIGQKVGIEIKANAVWHW